MEKGMLKKLHIVEVILRVLILICAVALVISYGVKKVNEKTSISADLARARSYDQITSSDKKVENTNDQIEFYAYFLRDLDGNGYAEEIKGSCTNVSSTDDLYISLNVLAGGTLKNGKITLTDANNISWELNLISDEVVAKNYINSSSTTIELQDSISSGYGAEITAAISANLGNNIYNYTATNSVTLTGTYVDENGNETEISKTSEFIVDWYGTISTSITQTTQRKDYKINVDETQEVDVDFKVITSASTNLILKENYVEVEMTDLNGYFPTGVSVNNSGITYEYDEETYILKIYNESSVNTTTGNMQKTIANSNIYYVTVTYPVYETDDSTSLNYGVTSTYTAYNNENEEFENSISTTKGIVSVIYSELSVQNGHGQIALMSTTTTIGTYVKENKNYVIPKEKVSNVYDNGMEDEEEDTYTVRWCFNPGGYSVDGLQIEETSQDKVLNSNKTYIDMSNYISNKGIWFTSSLSSSQYIKLYNAETGELIETFTNKNISNYNSSSKLYEFNEEVSLIRVETNKSSLNCYVIKKIDDVAITEDFTKEEFDEFSCIFTYVKYTVNIQDKTESTVFNKTAVASYEEKKSTFSTSLNVTSMQTNETLENERITITTSASGYNQKEWTNGSFLVKFSNKITALEINDVYSHNSDLKISGYELYKEDGYYFLKIITSNESATTYTIYIDCNITVEQTESASSISIGVYGANEDCTNYMSDVKDIYDVNNNNDTEDTVGYASKSITLQKTSTVLTSQRITNYDDEDNITISPSIADVERGKTADINLTVYNNSKNSLSEISILGQIPFEGNTYIVNDSSLGSEFTATMLESGIQLPDSVKNYATVYYSEKETVTTDVTDESNGWTTMPSNWSNVKYYLIDLGDYTANKGTSFTITYTVNVPENVDYNKITYSDYIVYYAENTSAGKHTTYRNASKIGIRAARKYNLDLTKYSTEGTNITVSGATYKAYDGEVTRLGTTNKTGEAILKNLYVDREYSLTEISAAKNYSLSDDEIIFKVTEDESGNLKITITSSDTFINTPIVDGTTIYAEVEDEPQYQLEITKKDADTEELLQGVKFAITSRAGTYTTNAEGKTTIYYLDQHETYTLSEVKADGYYLLDNIDFRVEKNEQGNFYVVSENDAFANAEITYDESTDTIKISVKLENVKKPSIIITKENEDGEKLTGVKIQDTSTNKVYTTDEDGKVTMYFEENTEYTIKETKAEGYYLQEIKFKIVTDANGKFKVESENQDFADAVLTDEENKVLSVTLVNEKIPTYTLKIKKVDSSDTDTVLENAEFQFKEYDKSEINTYTTDENGLITLNGLYVYVDGKEISAEYQLQEITAPDGYSNNAEEIELRVEQNDDKTLSANILSEDDVETVEDISVEDDVVTITIKDKPLFKLTKVDSKTGELLANAEFIIYELDEDGNILDYAKDVNDAYVGTQDEDGQYIVTTNENGVISLPLKDGSYMIIEVTYPEGYTEEDVVEYFKVGTDESEEDTEDTKDIEDIDKAREEVTLEINCIEDLVELSNTVNYNSSTNVVYNVTLKRNLDFTDSESYRKSDDTSYGDLNGDGTIEGIKDELTNTDGTGFTPIGQSATYYFSGTFDGQGNEIQNIYINLPNTNFVGLFGYVVKAQIKNLGISGEIIGNNYVGGIVGYNYGYTTISNCYNMGDVTGKGTTGGIVGYNYGYNYAYITISNCYNTGNITNVNTSSGYVGGIAGYNYGYTTISNCYNKGSITENGSNSYGNSYYAGGIAGYNTTSNVNIEKCRNNGTITCTGEVSGTSTSLTCKSYSGGIAGNGSGTIIGCYNIGDITSTSTCKNTSTSSSSKTNSYSYSGGIIGYGGTVNNCYNIGKVSSSSTSTIKKGTKYNYSYSGRIKGYGTATNCYYLEDIEIVGSTINEESTEETSTYMKTEDFVKDLGTEYFAMDTNDENDGYPVNLSSDVAEEEKTTITKEIYYIEDLVDLSNYVNSNTSAASTTYDVTLARTLDFNDTDSYRKSDDTSYGDLNGDGTVEGIKDELTNEDGTGFTPIGNSSTNYFIGTFDGQGNEIQNIYINLPNVSGVGLFGNITDVVIKKLGISGEIIGYKYVGGIVGYVMDYSTVYINNCYNNASIEGDEIVGGVVGFVSNYSTIYINNCYNSASMSIEGTAIIGGIIGESYYNAVAYANNCYNVGDINGYMNGGILGYCYNAEITNCYNAGNITCNNYSGYAGGIIGYTQAGTKKITNCYNTGTITGNGDSSSYKVGGIVGFGYEIEIINCYNTGEIISTKSDGTGGIIGYIGSSSATNNITNCYNAGTITNVNTYSGYVGGIVGYSSSTTNITNCYNNGLIQHTGEYTGGIIGGGSSTVEINNCYNLGNIKVNNTYSWTCTGGIIGYKSSDATITNCYNAGKIEILEAGSSIYTGGIVGYGGRSIKVKDCYNTSDIIISNTTESSIYCYTGGITGCCYGNMEKCYNIGNISNSSISSGYNYAYIGGIIGQGSITITDCYNIGNITNNTTSTSSENYAYIGGIIGQGGTTTNCYNVGEINNKQIASNSYCHAFISGIGGGGTAVSNCYNIGNIINNSGDYIGNCSIGGISYEGTVTNCFNTGNISSSVNYSDSSSWNYVGGIVGYGTATNCYNSGNVNSVITESLNTANCIGGIAGDLNNTSRSITNCYNLGNVTSNSTSDKNYIGKIVGYNSSGTVTDSYYLNTVTLNVNNSSTHIINNEGKKLTGIEDYSEIGFYDLRSEEFYNIINTNGVWTHVSNYYPKLLIMPLNLEASVELTVGNTIKTYSITTDINEIDGQRGGTISGEDENPYETVTYGESNTKEIAITTEDGYGISNITVNGATIDYTVDEDGNYTIPAGYFTNVQRNIQVEVTYTQLDQLLVIKKVDEDDTTKALEGATFKIENNNTPENTTFGQIVANGTYYFEESTETEGTYLPNGEGSNYSYIEIDLSDKTGTYVISVNAEVTADSSILCAGITGNTTVLSTTSEDGKFIYLTEVTAAADYTSEALEGGYSYYLQFAYSGEASGASINSITLYEVEVVETQVEVGEGEEKTTETVTEYKYLDNGTEFENKAKDSDWFYSGEYTTNSSGEIRLELPAGEYTITEITAPDGYILDETPITVTIGTEVSNTLTITNKAKPTVVTHYYLKDSDGNYTTTKVAEDVVTEYETGDTYKTSLIKVDNLTLEKDEKGEYVIPENATGTITDGQIEVTYYYEASPIELTVHHYIDGSNTELAPDEVLEIESTVEIDENTNMVTKVTTSEEYELESNDTYKELIESYTLTFVASTEDVLSIGEIYTVTSNSELTYYYESEDTYKYTIEYYINEEIYRTDTNYAELNTEVTYVDIFEEDDDYTLDKVENSPLIITENEEQNIIKVYYTLNAVWYKVEFYKDEVVQEDDSILKTYSVDADDENKDIISVYDVEIDELKYKCYSFDKIVIGDEKVDKLPETVTNGTIIKIYYTKIEYSYKIEYYKDETKQEDDTIAITPEESEISDDNVTITVNSTKVGADSKYEGYKISYFILNDEQEQQETMPATVVNGDTIKVYYVKAQFNYTVEYYYEGEIDETKTVQKEATYGDVINTYEDKVIEGYELNKTEGLPLTISATEGENVIKVYYTKIAETEPDPEPDHETDPEPETDPDPEPETKTGKIIIRYVDIETGEELDVVEIEGTVGETYTLEEKTFENYKIETELESNEIVIEEGEKEITFYCRKQYFSVSVEKTITQVTVNGVSKTISDNKLMKVEIKAKEVASTELRIKYNVKICNTGTIDGTVTVEDLLPEGVEIVSSSALWEENEDGDYVAEVDIDAGEEKNLEITVRWINSEDNFGTIQNVAELISTSNKANFEDTSSEDNTSTATIIVGVRTGLDENLKSVIQILSGLLLIMTGLIILKKIR